MRAKRKHKQSSAERRLEKALCAKLNCIEGGLKFICKQEAVKYPGKRRESNDGRLDIKAKDRRGRTVIIELKAGKAGRRAVGQILGYMGALSPRNRRIRGVLIAKKFSPQGKCAARLVPSLRLVKISRLRLKSLTYVT